MKKLLLIAMSVLLMGVISSMSYAGGDEVGVLSGMVIDLETEELVEGAYVFVVVCPAEEDELGGGGPYGPHGPHGMIYSDTTDEFGEFYIEDIPAGEYTAKARKKGIGRDEETVLIEAGFETIVTFELGPCDSGLQYQLRHHGGE